MPQEGPALRMTTKYPRIRRDLSRMGLGVVQFATKAKNERQHADRLSMFNDLVDDGQIGVLKALLSGQVSWEQLKEHKRKSGFIRNDALADIALSAKLSVALAANLSKMGKGEKGRTRYRNSLEQLIRLIGDVPVRELESQPWGAIMEAHKASGRSAADWNHIGRAISSLLSTMLGKRDPARHRAVDAFTATKRPEPSRVPDLSQDVFYAIVEASTPVMQATYYTLLLTGMRAITEYCKCTKDHLMPATFRVRVPGTKTKGSAAVVAIAPEMWGWVESGIPSRFKYTWIRTQWIRACIATGNGKMVEKPSGKLGYVGLRLHDLRHALAQWASDAGVPLVQVQAQMRHASLAMTGKYAQQAGARAVASAMGGILQRKVGT